MNHSHYTQNTRSFLCYNELAIVRKLKGGQRYPGRKEGDAYDDSISNVNAYDSICKFGVVHHIF
jgi:hypothetical protein